MVTIACVLRSGGAYDATWVSRVAAQIRAHQRQWVDYQFVCLSDVRDLPCERIPLTDGRPGWWSKIELFKLPGPVLYLDLDTLVIGDLSDFLRVAEAGRLTMLRDFTRPEGLGSGVMAWGPESCANQIYNKFMSDPDQWMAMAGGGGDQRFIEMAVSVPSVLRWQDVLPGQIVSYKISRCEDGPPAGARVVCLHGEPKFTSMAHNNWARQAWERAA